MRIFLLSFLILIINSQDELKVEDSLPGEFDITFINRFDFPVIVWWQDNNVDDDDHEYHPQFVLQSGEQQTFGSFEGHIFHVYTEDDAESMEDLLARFVVDPTKKTYLIQEKNRQSVKFTNNFDQTLQVWYHDGNEAHPLVEVAAGSTFEDEAIADSVYIATPQGANEPILWKTLIHEDKDEYKIEL